MQASISLSKAQKARIKSFIVNKTKSITLSLKAKQLTGNDKLYLNKRQLDHVAKAKTSNKGCDITLTQTTIRANKKQQDSVINAVIGGAVTVSQVLEPVQKIASALIKPEDVQRLDNLLAKYKRGSGISDAQYNNVRDGFLYMVSDPKKGSELLYNAVKNFGTLDPESVNAQYKAGVERNGYNTGRENSSEADSLAKYRSKLKV